MPKVGIARKWIEEENPLQPGKTHAPSFLIDLDIISKLYIYLI